MSSTLLKKKKRKGTLFNKFLKSKSGTALDNEENSLTKYLQYNRVMIHSA